MKDSIEQAAAMLSLGYTEHEIIRIMHVPPSMAEELIQKAEQWNDEVYVPYTEKDIDAIAAYYGS